MPPSRAHADDLRMERPRSGPRHPIYDSGAGNGTAPLAEEDLGPYEGCRRRGAASTGSRSNRRKRSSQIDGLRFGTRPNVVLRLCFDSPSGAGGSGRSSPNYSASSMGGANVMSPRSSRTARQAWFGTPGPTMQVAAQWAGVLPRSRSGYTGYRSAWAASRTPSSWFFSSSGGSAGSTPAPGFHDYKGFGLSA